MRKVQLTSDSPFSTERLETFAIEFRQYIEPRVMLGMEVRTWEDKMGGRLIVDIQAMLASKRLPDEVQAREMTIEWEIPLHWIDQLKIEKPWVQKLLGKPIMKKCSRTEKYETRVSTVHLFPGIDTRNFQGKYINVPTSRQITDSDMRSFR